MMTMGGMEGRRMPSWMVGFLSLIVVLVLLAFVAEISDMGGNE